MYSCSHKPWTRERCTRVQQLQGGTEHEINKPEIEIIQNNIK